MALLTVNPLRLDWILWDPPNGPFYISEYDFTILRFYQIAFSSQINYWST